MIAPQVHDVHVEPVACARREADIGWPASAAAQAEAGGGGDRTRVPNCTSNAPLSASALARWPPPVSLIRMSTRLVPGRLGDTGTGRPLPPPPPPPPPPPRPIGGNRRSAALAGPAAACAPRSGCAGRAPRPVTRVSSAVGREAPAQRVTDGAKRCAEVPAHDGASGAGGAHRRGRHKGTALRPQRPGVHALRLRVVHLSPAPACHPPHARAAASLPHPGGAPPARPLPAPTPHI